MGQHLISVDELRAMGALDVPEDRRKSLGKSEPNLFSDNGDSDEKSKKAKKTSPKKQDEEED